MKIRLSKFVVIDQCTCAPFLWDLFTVSTGIRKGEEQVVETFKASGLSLGQVLNMAPDFHLNEKYELTEDEYLDLKRYVEEFKAIQEEMFERVKSLKIK